MTMKSFTLKRRGQKYLCLTIQGKNKTKIVATNCSSSSLSMRWIWVNKPGKLHLMNIMTLQCLEFLTNEDVCRIGQTAKLNQTGHVAMKQCKDIDGQGIVDKNAYLIYSNLCNRTRPYYLQLNQQHDSPYPVQSLRRATPPQEWENERENLHHRSSNYTGQCSVLGQ